MLVAEKINLTIIKYHGSNDLSTNWLINEFEKNNNLIYELLDFLRNYDYYHIF